MSKDNKPVKVYSAPEEENPFGELDELDSRRGLDAFETRNKTPSEKRKTAPTIDDTDLQVGYAPTKEMKRLKAELMAACAGKTTGEIKALTLEDVVALGLKSKKLPSLFNNSAFVEWFLNPAELDVRVSYLLARSLDNIEEIIDGSMELYSVRDKLSAQKQLLDIFETVKRIGDSSSNKQTALPAKALDPKEIAKRLFESEQLSKKEEKKREKDVTIVFPINLEGE